MSGESTGAAAPGITILLNVGWVANIGETVSNLRRYLRIFRK